MDDIQVELTIPEMDKEKNAHYLNTPDSEILNLLDDPQSRVRPMFRVLPELKEMVGFWMLIYSKYSVFQTILYDKDNPSKIYEVIDNREYFAKGLSAVKQEINAKNKIRKKIRDYRAAIDKLIKNPKTKFKKGTSGAKVIALWGRKSTSTWKKIRKAIRTQLGQRDKVIQAIELSDRFMPAMESIFRKYALPPELTRIPIVESSFNPKAISKADAVGVWQFLERSAKEYLVVDDYNKIDERLSPIKSTYAAAKMFKRNYRLLDDYALAIIAYNHGPKNLLAIKRKYRGANIAKLLKLKKNSPLGYASKNYYAEFLAILHAEKYRDQLYGLTFRQHSDAISIVKLKKPASIFEIAALYNISLYELRMFNPDIFDIKRRLPIGTRIVIPRKSGESVVSSPHNKSQERGVASQIEFIDYIH
ncbi:MAG: lytic transglycosylase domain-containing protein [Bacteriovoracia bacterium]